MKKLLMAAVAVAMVFSVVGCDKSGGADVELEGSWDKAAKEYPFLQNFPAYDYDFQGSYQKTLGVDTYILADRKGSEAKWNGYKSKLSKAGFAEEVMPVGNASSFTKTDVKGEYTATPSLSSGVVTVSYSFRPAE